MQTGGLLNEKNELEGISHENSGYQRRFLVAEVSADRHDERKGHGQGPGRAHRHRRFQSGSQVRRGLRLQEEVRAGHRQSHRGHEAGAGSAGRQRGRRDFRRSRDQRRRSPRAARRHGVHPVLHHRRRVQGGHQKVHPPRPAAQSRQPDGHRGLRKGHARRAQRGRVRHRLPSDHAREGLSVRRAAQVFP